MKLKLNEWAKRHFSTPPCRQTLYKWREEGMISPAPLFDGRYYWVEENAQFVGYQPCAPKKARKLTKSDKPRLAERI